MGPNRSKIYFSWLSWCWFVRLGEFGSLLSYWWCCLLDVLVVLDRKSRFFVDASEICTLCNEKMLELQSVLGFYNFSQPGKHTDRSVLFCLPATRTARQISVNRHQWICAIELVAIFFFKQWHIRLYPSDVIILVNADGFPHFT
ncbi:unnamed protein product [Urochloa humidicola]